MVLESTLLMRTFLRNELLANRWIPKDSCCSRNRILAQLRCRVAFKWRLELADDRLAQSWYPLPWTDPSTIAPAHLRIQFLTDMQWWEWRYTRMLMSWKYFIVICLGGQALKIIDMAFHGVVVNRFASLSFWHWITPFHIEHSAAYYGPSRCC